MKEVKKESIYAAIKVLLEVSGCKKSDISNVMNLIVPKVPKANTKQNSKNKPGRKGTSMDSIMSALASNPEEMYDIERINKESGVAIRTIGNYIKQLRNSRKVKVVGCNLNNPGVARLYYQGYRSPLKALKTVTPKEGYTSIHNFVKNNKELLGKSITPSSFGVIVEQEGLTVYPMLLNVGIVRGYKTTELQKLAERAYSSKEEKPKRKYTKRAKAKHKYTQRAKVQPVEVQVEQPVKNGFSILGSLFKKKQETSDLIKF